jgi:hypothetical protein
MSINLLLNKSLAVLTFSFFFILITKAQSPASVDSIATITTAEVSDITANTAVSGGNVLSDGGATVRYRGVCWNTSGSPTINDNKTIDGYGTGSFQSTLTDLKLLTKYYVRAYATNSSGTVYGNEVSFETKDTSDLIAAFPGAEGFGKYTSGGRGGKVLEVTDLNDSGPGSLRDAIEQNYPRIIVFRISGTIMLQSDLNITNGNLTIAGQTAPGDGICIANHTTELKANNVIIRYLRFRLGDLSKEANDSFWGRDNENIILDHCSFSWAIDENGSWYDNKFFTMQWCINGESLYHSYHPKGNHGYGGIWGGMGATFHHNLIADNTSRNPRFNGARYNSTFETELADFRNNVIFNWGFNSAYGGEAGNYNLINNYYKPGPATSSSKKNRIVNPSDTLNSSHFSKWYITGNYVEGDAQVSADNWDGGVQPQYLTIPLDTFKLEQPLPVYYVSTQSAQDAYNSVLESAGASFPKRDSVDLRIINEVKTGSAPFGASYNGGNKGIIDSQNDVGGWPLLHSNPAPADSDHDGMPDSWEITHNLNPNDPSDASNIDSNGYSMIEEYINSLVTSHISSIDNKKQNPKGYSLKQNYPNPFNPVTKIEFSIPFRSKVKLDIYDVLGRKILTLVNGEKSAGMHTISFDGSNLSSGIYLYRLESPDQILTKKMVLLK